MPPRPGRAGHDHAANAGIELLLPNVGPGQVANERSRGELLDATWAAVRDAADPTKWPEHGEPWQVAKLYYHMGFHRRRFERLDELLHEHGHERVYAERLARMDDHLTQRLTTFVPCAEYFHVRDEALRAHATQVDPDGFWFAVPLEIQKLGWPTEDYQLVKSMVPVTLPEDDLFAGLETHFVDRLETWFYSI